MKSKFDQIADRFFRLPMFVPDIAGPWALPSAAWPPAIDGFAEDRAGHVGSRTPRWSR